MGWGEVNEKLWFSQFFIILFRKIFIYPTINYINILLIIIYDPTVQLHSKWALICLVFESLLASQDWNEYSSVVVSENLKYIYPQTNATNHCKWTLLSISLFSFYIFLIDKLLHTNLHFYPENYDGKCVGYILMQMRSPFLTNVS